MDTTRRTHYNQVSTVCVTALYVSPEVMDTTRRTHYNQVSTVCDSPVCESRGDGYNTQNSLQPG